MTRAHVAGPPTATPRASTSAGPGVAVRRLASLTEMTEAFASMDGSAREEIVELLPGRGPVGPVLRASRADDVASLERGVARYLVCESSCLDDAVLRDELDVRRRAGARVRVVDRTQVWMRMFDRRAAILPSVSVPVPNALVIHEGSVVRSLQALFAGAWHRADDVGPDAPAGRRPRDRDVLRILSRGDTDESAARSLDVSVRTYRRHVAALMSALGATSRFQAGVLAASRGWI